MEMNSEMCEKPSLLFKKMGKNILKCVYETESI